jgi:hypothetical protein
VHAHCELTCLELGLSTFSWRTQQHSHVHLHAISLNFNFFNFINLVFYVYFLTSYWECTIIQLATSFIQIVACCYVDGCTYFDVILTENVKSENKGTDSRGRNVPEEVVSMSLTSSNGYLSLIRRLIRC